ncbi:MAG: hypothetical protein PHD81_03420 [Candidatus Nanoarchaeia archaeon]|nr:hypothetical protein [Candidatus Nanoarchaeia archaeon]MDD5588134.1 hypothetical protein [Candidatus Nanoarchaeia archaeon]
MKNKLLIGLFVVCLILMGGCEAKNKCSQPNVIIGDQCCLDSNVNIVCDPSEREAEKIGQELARAMSFNDYGAIYDSLVSSSKALRSKEDFILYGEAEDDLSIIRYGHPSSLTITYDKIIFTNNTEAYLYLIASNALAEKKMPSVMMYYENNTWKIDAFADWLIRECVVDDCHTNSGEQKVDCSRESEYKCHDAVRLYRLENL